jgi:hypothetical protein
MTYEELYERSKPNTMKPDESFKAYRERVKQQTFSEIFGEQLQESEHLKEGVLKSFFTQAIADTVGTLLNREGPAILETPGGLPTVITAAVLDGIRNALDENGYQEFFEKKIVPEADRLTLIKKMKRAEI